MQNQANKVVKLLTTWDELCTKVCRILSRRDMTSQRFAHGNGFANSMIANCIRFLLQSRPGSLCIVNHGHVVAIDIGWSGNLDAHHTKLVT